MQPEEMVTLGDMTFHFFPVCHSIPQGYALGVETPVGRIVLTGDFKIDPHPLAGSGTDIKLFRRFAGRKGVKLLMSDSTNVEREGRSLTEREVQNSLDKVFAQAPGRIVITLFSSHIQLSRKCLIWRKSTDVQWSSAGAVWPTILKWPRKQA